MKLLLGLNETICIKFLIQKKASANASFILSPSNTKAEKQQIPRLSSLTFTLDCGHSVTQLLDTMSSH